VPEHHSCHRMSRVLLCDKPAVLGVPIKKESLQCGVIPYLADIENYIYMTAVSDGLDC